MGTTSSTEKFLAAPLSRQRDFPFTINPRFCKSRETTLVLRDNFWGRVGDDGFAVTVAGTGRTLFHVQRSVAGAADVVGSVVGKTKWLVDAYKIPIAHVTEGRTYTTAYDVYVGKDHDYRFTQIEVQYLPMDNNPCSAEIQNLDTGELSGVGVHGIWRQRTAFIFLDRGKTGERRAIAKVFRPDLKRADFGGDALYHVTIAPGVDIAFIVLVCGALDDALQHAIGAP